VANVKEHATLSAGASVDHGVDVEITENHVNRAADRGCVSRLVLLLHWLHRRRDGAPGIYGSARASAYATINTKEKLNVVVTIRRL